MFWHEIWTSLKVFSIWIWIQFKMTKFFFLYFKIVMIIIIHCVNDIQIKIYKYYVMFYWRFFVVAVITLWRTKVKKKNKKNMKSVWCTNLFSFPWHKLLVFNCQYNDLINLLRDIRTIKSNIKYQFESNRFRYNKTDSNDNWFSAQKNIQLNRIMHQPSGII